MALLTSLFTLNPEVEKFSFLNRSNIEMENIYLEEEVVDLKNTYHFTGIISNEKADFLKSQILDFFKSADADVKISADVLSQCYSFIDNLYPSVLEQLEIDDVYSTSYGTVVFDWEKDVDNVFSLEIGAKEIGYFIEVNGTDDKQVDSLILDESENELLQDLSSFLSV
ncbi:hypothetical protein POV26_13935 [Aequorivita todarodis]|uniref:hypothetical protein n=1 Tax=Aequorivita todarodis TaxID=2036821 RepID=UPI0023502809|nr:hypothetical protein [Aequorivita todarodis]MDC8002142.1 hypothetical protein [Aequorivita todarodis]